MHALHKAVLFIDTGILVLPAVQYCWIVFSVTHCNLSSLFLHSCLSGTRLKAIGKPRIFLNLQIIPDFRDEIPLPGRNVAVSGSLGELLPYLKGRELSCPHVAHQSQLLLCHVGLFSLSSLHFLHLLFVLCLLFAG